MSDEQAPHLGTCCICGGLIDNASWDAQNVVATVQPEGVALCHAHHIKAGPGTEEYERAVRMMAEATAKLLQGK
jgi:hypothetical protein